MATITIGLPRAAFVRPLATLRQGLIVVAETLVRWQERADQRLRLSGLDEHLLKDIGLSRADTLPESAKPFWKA